MLTIKEGNVITKKIYAQYFIDEFKKNHNLPTDISNKDLNQYVMSHASLGICLEVLGELDPKYKTYIADNDGASITIPFKLENDLYPYRIDKNNEMLQKSYRINNLTMRKLMELLPD